MPLMDLTLPAGVLDAETRATLIEELSATLLRAERAPDTEFFRSITWVHVHELPAGDVIAAGKPVEQPVFRVDVSIPEGALSERRKQEFVGAATERILAAAGLDESHALRVWILIREIPDGNWGAGGQLIQFAQLRDIAASERDKVEQPA